MQKRQDVLLQQVLLQNECRECRQLELTTTNGSDERICLRHIHFDSNLLIEGRIEVDLTT